MNTYSNPLTVPYNFGNLNFVSGAGTYKVKPPPRATCGRVEDIHVRVTTLFTQVTTPAYVRVGTSGDNLKYAELNMGAAAAGAAYNTRDVAGSIKSNINLTKDAISDVDIRVVAPTGGSPAGVGYLDVIISWWA
jgi:hypothetical protein